MGWAEGQDPCRSWSPGGQGRLSGRKQPYTDLLAGFVRPCYTQCMAIYAFTSQSTPALRGFTSDETGKNLPATYAPWKKVTAGVASGLDRQNHPVAQAVLRHGFFVVSTRNATRTHGTAA